MKRGKNGSNLMKLKFIISRLCPFQKQFKLKDTTEQLHNNFI